MTPDECPTPGKKAHPVKWQAEQAMFNCWKSPRPGSPLPIRVYECACGYWHLTHKADWA